MPSIGNGCGERNFFMARIELVKMKFGDVVYRQFNLDLLGRYNVFSFVTTGFNVVNDDEGHLVLRSLQPKSKSKEIKVQSLIAKKYEHERNSSDDLFGEFREFTFFSSQLESLQAELDYYLKDMDQLTEFDYDSDDDSASVRLWKVDFLRKMIASLDLANRCQEQSKLVSQSV
jgi:hypothetical protein